MFNIFQNQEKNMHYLNLYSNLSQSVVPLHSHNSLVNPISSNLTLTSINNVINNSKTLQNGKGNKNSTSKRTRQTSHKFKNELCRVCGDKASGYHYKAITCEGCKVFFLRCVATNAQFNQCHSGGNCEMDLYTRRKCQYCRFQKCLSVGMKPECVVLDRQRSRQADKQQQNGGAGTVSQAVAVKPTNQAPNGNASAPCHVSVGGPIPSSPAHSSTSSPQNNHTGGHPDPSPASVASPSRPVPPRTPVSPAAAPGKISAAAIIAASRATSDAAAANHHVNQNGGVGNAANTTSSPLQYHRNGTNHVTTTPGPVSAPVPPYANGHPSCTTVGVGGGYAPHPYPNMVGNCNNNALRNRPDAATISLPLHHTTMTTGSSAPAQSTSATAVPKNGMCPPPDHNMQMDETTLYSNCLDYNGFVGRATSLNRHQGYNGTANGQGSNGHHSPVDIVGWSDPLHPLSLGVGGRDDFALSDGPSGGALLQCEQRKLIERLVFYQDQFELPSEDVVRGIEEFFENDKKTNHNEKMFLMMAQFSMLNIQLIIEFSKRLPGFQTLIRQDQITILKACMYEIMLIKTARRYDINTDTIVCCNNKPYTRENFKIAGIVEVCDSMFDFCRGMALLKVDNAEYALLTSICLFEERPALIEPKKVEIIQEYYLDTLRSYIECHRPTGSNMLARLLVKLRDLRELNNNHSSMLYSLKVQNFQIPPLMAELWDLPDNFQN